MARIFAASGYSPTSSCTLWKAALAALRRSAAGVFRASAVVSALALAGPACAAYPEKQIQLILSFPPAGATDILARAIGQGLSDKLGQPVVVDNRPGAGGNIGLAAAAKAAPDGYTIYLAAVTNAAIAAAAYKTSPAHLIKDFDPVAGVGNVPHMLVVPTTLPAKNVSELVSLLKAAPGKHNFASQGTGTLSHLESELFREATQVQITHIPYKGSSQALPDLIAGSSSMMFDSIPASMPHVKSGKLRVLAVASGKRVSSLPDVPTVQEAGVKGFEANNLFGFIVPKGTPPEAIAKLAKALESVVNSPDLRRRMGEQGVELQFTPTAEFGKMIETEFKTWGKAVKQADIKLD